MVNFGLNSASILGIMLAVAGAALYFLRSVRPELARDHDIFFAAVGLLCGFILLFQGWRLDPILQFGQVLLSASTIFFAVESIRLRDVATKQAKQNTPIVDEERPVSSVYRYEQVAELDELEPYEERPTRPRIRGTKDARPNRTDEYDDEPPRRRTDEYDDEPRRRSSSRSSSAERLGSGNRVRKRSSRPVSRPTERPEADEWGSGSPKPSNDDWDSSGGMNKPSRGSNGTYSADRSPDVASRPKKKRRPPQDSVAQREPDVEATPTDYVDYKPIDYPDDDLDNSGNFDER